MEKADLVEHLEDLEQEADRLRRLTEDLLVISRAEDGQLIVARDPLVLGRVLTRVAAGEQERFPGHRFETRLEEPLPLVLGEELYLEQVISNLLSNAAKYSPPATTISVSGVAADGGAVVRVIDHGSGLGDQPPEQLFELFYRAPGSRRRGSGAGIGLYVCRELVRALGGRIWARNADPPAGAEFGFWLPAAAEERAPTNKSCRTSVRHELRLFHHAATAGGGYSRPWYSASLTCAPQSVSAPSAGASQIAR